MWIDLQLKFAVVVYVLSNTTITSPSSLSVQLARNSVAVSGLTDMPNISDSIFNFPIMMFPMEKHFDLEMVPLDPPLRDEISRRPLSIAN